ncbi:hypothetical protein ACFV0C_12950 [Streptomyces sp. NPDC059568]|uniref:hypothetical protein n=1 Tax=Streptomyces sp. NPDC059568 TaxID=3346868 RepID=UPI0036B111C4
MSDSEIINPEGNSLKAGLTKELLTEAIEKSGHPLQSAIFELLSSEFSVQQEWGFRDRITGDMRSCDLLATKTLASPPSEESRIRTSLAVLIECKQSDMPYVFFSPSTPPWRLVLPQVTGLRHDQVKISTDDSHSSWTFPVMKALEMTNDPFLNRVGFSIMSKCARKGSKLELSGTDAYSSVVMPLISAATHFSTSSAPIDTWHWFDVHLLYAVAVIDAPMIAARTTESGTELEFTPWGRIFRHEPEPPGSFMQYTGRTAAIDVVHKDFFREYLLSHLIPFAAKFSERAIKHNQVLASGAGFAEGMGANGSDNIEGRLQPMKLIPRTSRRRPRRSQNVGRA